MDTESELRWSVIQEAIVGHFKSAERQKVILSFPRFRNFFEGWLTAEILYLLAQRWPNAKMVSNEDFKTYSKSPEDSKTYSKPDIAFSHHDFTCVMEIKHLPTHHPGCRPRWNGAKKSTVAKDICKLYEVQDTSVARYSLAFYGLANLVSHMSGGACSNHRERCLECSLKDLKETIKNTCGFDLPQVEPLCLLNTDQGDFYLLVFNIGGTKIG